MEWCHNSIDTNSSCVNARATVTAVDCAHREITYTANITFVHLRTIELNLY